jgi:hypothetical protein
MNWYNHITDKFPKACHEHRHKTKIKVSPKFLWVIHSSGMMPGFWKFKAMLNKPDQPTELGYLSHLDTLSVM